MADFIKKTFQTAVFVIVVFMVVFSCQTSDKKETETVPGQQWWKEAVVYQIYPRSFKDSDGDGIGDFVKRNAQT